MSPKKTAMVYPYNNEFTPYLRFWDYPEYEINHLVSPKGLMLHDKDASWADMGPHIGITVESNFFEVLNQVDAVILADYGSYVTPRGLSGYYIEQKLDLSLEKAKLALSHGKEVFCLADLGADRTEELKIYSQEAPGVLCFSPENHQPPLHKIITPDTKITAPIVFVLGESENTGKFQVELSLRENLTQRGYRVSLLGSRRNCEVVGARSLLTILLNSHIRESEKIDNIHKYIYWVNQEEQPDIIIVGIPGGILPFNEKLHNGHGILAFMVSRSITPDFTVYCMNHWENINQEFLQCFRDILKYRFGCGLDCIHMSRNELDWIKANKFYEEFYLRYEGSMKKCLQEMRTYHPHSYDMLDSTSLEQMVDTLIESLSEENQPYVMEKMGGLTYANFF